MKTHMLILLNVLFSMNSFAQETAVPKGAIKNGTLKAGQYLLHKISYGNGARMEMDQPVILEVLSISQQSSSKVKSSDLGKCVEGSGSVGRVATTIEVNIIDRGKITHCTLKSAGVVDGGSDFMGYDSQRVKCAIDQDGKFTQITLVDYTYNVGEQTNNIPVAGVELTVDRKKNSYSAFIGAE